MGSASPVGRVAPRRDRLRSDGAHAVEPGKFAHAEARRAGGATSPLPDLGGSRPVATVCVARQGASPGCRFVVTGRIGKQQRQHREQLESGRIATENAEENMSPNLGSDTLVASCGAGKLPVVPRPVERAACPFTPQGTPDASITNPGRMVLHRERKGDIMAFLSVNMRRKYVGNV